MSFSSDWKCSKVLDILEAQIQFTLILCSIEAQKTEEIMDNFIRTLHVPVPSQFRGAEVSFFDDTGLFYEEGSKAIFLRHLTLSQK